MKYTIILWKGNSVMKLFFSIILLVIILVMGIVNVSALNTGFETEDMPDERKNEFLSDIDLQVLSKESYNKNRIECFDVNSKGMVAIGMSKAPHHRTICVYSSDGVFQYGYTFKSNGSFGIEWDGDNLNIYLVRSMGMVSLSNSGYLKGACVIKDTFENIKYENNVIFADEKIVDGVTYRLKNTYGILDPFSKPVSQVIRISENGKEKVICGIEMLPVTNVIVIVIAAVVILFFVFIVGFIVAYAYKRKRRKLNL